MREIVDPDNLYERLTLYIAKEYVRCVAVGMHVAAHTTDPLRPGGRRVPAEPIAMSLNLFYTGFETCLSPSIVRYWIRDVSITQHRQVLGDNTPQTQMFSAILNKGCDVFDVRAQRCRALGAAGVVCRPVCTVLAGLAGQKRTIDQHTRRA